MTAGRRVRTGGGHRSHGLGRLKRVLLTLCVVGGMVTVAGGGTLASLNAQVTDAASSVTTGTLTLSDTATAGTACVLSSSSGSAAGDQVSGCGTLVSTSAPLYYPGQAAATASVNVKNGGSLNATSLSVYNGRCVKQDETAGIGLYTGGGNPCNEIDFYLQETTSSGSPSYCWYPVQQAGACPGPFRTGATLAAFNAAHGGAASTDLLNSGPAGTGLAAGSTRYFTLGFQLEATTTLGGFNSYQGEQAVFDFTWALDQ